MAFENSSVVFLKVLFFLNPCQSWIKIISNRTVLLFIWLKVLERILSILYVFLRSFLHLHNFCILLMGKLAGRLKGIPKGLFLTWQVTLSEQVFIASCLIKGGKSLTHDWGEQMTAKFSSIYFSCSNKSVLYLFLLFVHAYLWNTKY